MKQVCVNMAACSRTRSATRGALLPTETTAMPEPKSMSELPSASTSTPPPAAVMNTGRMLLTPRATARSRRASSSREAGPGISVTRRRCWGSPGPPVAGGFVVIDPTIRHRPTGREVATAQGPACVIARPGYSKSPPLSVLTAMFVHAGWLHLLGNMLFLLIFGNNIEDRFRKVPYLIFYLACGYVAAYGFAAV